MSLSVMIVWYLVTACIFMMYSYLKATEAGAEYSVFSYIFVGLFWPALLVGAIYYRIKFFRSPEIDNQDKQ